MFKRKVSLSSEKFIETLEDFLFEEGWHPSLSPEELYAFRYDLSDLEIDINNFTVIKKIYLNDIKECLDASSGIIYSDEGYFCKRSDEILFICEKINQRIILVKTKDNNNSNIVEEISVYLPERTDNLLHIKDIYMIKDDVCVADSEKDFIRDFSNHNKDIIKQYLQDNAILRSNEELNYSHEFLAITNLKIENSSVVFHYVP